MAGKAPAEDLLQHRIMVLENAQVLVYVDSNHKGELGRDLDTICTPVDVQSVS
mgnify:CR=1 FL=1